ncbi:hypothetical protein [Merismopedia glauca]|uniref:Uncharacterized protein n=1 Tax=Merismopedia glauca CCAP 1448/3 TaxID=1296344 RepID=A0A2T1C1N1_9CYAN|nr:hypothetical protein [Merismopedia glauca]PSB02023.1 hypothetical protein C7B64_15385 [Merismopedia glauca CCAP 1448/3]
MVVKQLTLLATVLLVSLPSVVIAGDVDVQAGNVRITTTESGGVSVDTGRNGVKLDSRSNIRANRIEKKRYCTKRRSSRRYRCYYKTKYSSDNSRRPSVYTDTTVLESPTYERSSRRVRSSSSHSCSGNSTYSNQEITQSSDFGEVYVENSISTSQCN